MRKLFTLFLLLCINLITYGAYLENIPTQLVQPNGEVLNLFKTGDEFYNRVHDSEGYSIVKGKDGWYYYAIYDEINDQLIPSEYVVTSNRDYELPMPKELGISQKKYLEIRRAYYEPTGCTVSGASKNSILNDLAKKGDKSTQKMANIVICIGFADTEEMTKPYSYVDGMFNTKEGNNMRDFFMTMSYNKLDIESYFYPPGNEEEDLLRFYQDPNPRAYYEVYHEIDNPIGYQDYERTEREQTLLKDAVEWVNQNWPIPTSINLDINNDGACDFISFVIKGAPGDWATLLWPHKWSLYYHDVFINGSQVWEYNFELDGNSTYFSNNVFCHEGYHVLGAPDLYHYSNPEGNGQPVGSWDLMEYSYLSKPQSMAAYMKYRYGNWVPALPTATVNKSYEVYPFYYNDGSDPEKPISYRMQMSGAYEQSSVVEYRKKTGTNYDAYIPNQGLLIYRVNSDFGGNAGFNGEDVFDELFLYRQNSVQTGGLYTGGNLNQAPFNTVNNRTEFNSETNPKPLFSDGTLDNITNINHIFLDTITDSYTFFYGEPTQRFFLINDDKLLISGEEGATGSLIITSSVFWRVIISETDKEWLAATRRGLNDGTIIFTALSDNMTGEKRTADVEILEGDNVHTVRVTQGTHIGIDEWDIAAQFSVYPNPTTGMLQVTSYELQVIGIEIFDIYGKNLTPHTLHLSPQTSIDISDLTSGIYFVQIQTEKGIVTKKIVKN